MYICMIETCAAPWRAGPTVWHRKRGWVVYYIAAINIESAYYGLNGGEYTPRNGILLPCIGFWTVRHTGLHHQFGGRPRCHALR